MEFIAILIVLGGIAAAILAISDRFGKGKREAAAAEIAKRNYDEALEFRRRKQLPSIRVSLLLQASERGILEEASILSEARASQSFGGGAVEVEGMMVGGLASAAVDQVEEIDSGTLVLTNRRLVFTGKMENRTLLIKDLLSVKHHASAIEISAAGKSQYYTVRNPIIWHEAINKLASGRVQL